LANPEDEKSKKSGVRENVDTHLILFVGSLSQIACRKSHLKAEPSMFT